MAAVIEYNGKRATVEDTIDGLEWSSADVELEDALDSYEKLCRAQGYGYEPNRVEAAALRAIAHLKGARIVEHHKQPPAVPGRVY